MRIAVDGYELVTPVTGVGRVTESLLAELARLMPETDFPVLLREKGRTFPEPNIRSLPLLPDRGYFRWQNGPFRSKWRALKADLMLATNYTLPLRPPGRSLLFVHDISFVSHPEWYGRREALKRRWLVDHSLRCCRLAVTDSRFSRDEIRRRFPAAAGKVRVVYPGLDSRFRPSDTGTVDAWKARRGLTGQRVIGYLGSIFNRRHVPELCAAVELLRREMPECRLMVVGRDLTKPARDLACLGRDWIIHRETIPDEELPVFYSALDAFAYLSEYEGFGLPPLEALGCGTVPVLLDRTSLREVYSKAAFMVDSPDPLRIRDALKRALTDPAAVRERLDGFEDMGSRLTWRRAASEVADLIREILSDRGEG